MAARPAAPARLGINREGGAPFSFQRCDGFGIGLLWLSHVRLRCVGDAQPRNVLPINIGERSPANLLTRPELRPIATWRDRDLRSAAKLRHVDIGKAVALRYDEHRLRPDLVVEAATLVIGHEGNVNDT